jgi:hypothetical protein
MEDGYGFCWSVQAAGAEEDDEGHESCRCVQNASQMLTSCNFDGAMGAGVCRSGIWFRIEDSVVEIQETERTSVPIQGSGEMLKAIGGDEAVMNFARRTD